MLYAKFNSLNIYDSHRFCLSATKIRRKVCRIPENEFPKYSSLRHCLAYQLFADACNELDIPEMEYLKIKKLKVYDFGNGVWKFEVVIKKGFFSKEKMEFIWDQDWLLKSKQKEKEKKEKEKEERRRYSLRRRRRF